MVTLGVKFAFNQQFIDPPTEPKLTKAYQLQGKLNKLGENLPAFIPPKKTLQEQKKGGKKKKQKQKRRRAKDPSNKFPPFR